MSHVPDEQLVQVFLALCEGASTPFSKRAASAALSGDWAGVSSLDVHPRDYTNAYHFKMDNAIACFFKKLPMSIDVDSKQVAIESFWDAERSCCATNKRFSRFRLNGLMDLTESRFLDRLERGRDWVRRVLGPLPRTLNGRFGPGGTFSDKGRLTTIPDKLSSVATITEEARDFLCPYWTDTAWYRSLCADRRPTNPQTVRGNRFTTVPKTARTDRGICIEPALNVYFQLDVGRFISRRLSRFAKLDKETGQMLHRSLAQRASLDGSLATIDLTSASDTVAIEFVRYMLPPDWFELLSALRSPMTYFSGDWVRLEKFSSMGNGFTFELETLLFAAICFSADCGESGSDFQVYGDDIIIPTAFFEQTIDLLRFCGFTPNLKKTFNDGLFRESCGGDFFFGFPVRGYYVKSFPNHPSDWISIINGLRRLCDFDDHDFTFHFAFLAWKKALSFLPRQISRIRGPQSLGDLVICSESFNRRWRNGIGYVRVLRPRLRPLPWYHWSSNTCLAAILYGSGDSRGVMPRGKPDSFKIGYVAFS